MSTEVLLYFFWRQLDLLEELYIQVVDVLTINCDNISTQYLTPNLVFHVLPKNIEIYFHFIRKLVMNKQLDVQYID